MGMWIYSICSCIYIYIFFLTTVYLHMWIYMYERYVLHCDTLMQRRSHGECMMYIAKFTAPAPWKPLLIDVSKLIKRK